MIRLINGAILILFCGLISALFFLTPAASGIGTHQQIIPVPCPILMALHIPCPSCGLTTSLTLLLKGRIYESFGAHPLGLLFLLIFLTIIILSAYGLITKHPWWSIFQKRWLQNSLLYGICLLIAVWIARLVY